MAAARWDADEASRALASAEGRLSRTDAGAAEAESQLKALRQQVNVQEQSLSAMQVRHPYPHPTMGASWSWGAGFEQKQVSRRLNMRFFAAPSHSTTSA